MNHRDTNPDEAIDRLLTGLREAEPPHGMQQRVLHAAKERASTRRRWSLQLPLTTNHSWAVAAATIAVIALAASWKIAVLARTHRAIHEIVHAPVQPTPSDVPRTEPHFASSSIAQLRPSHEPELASTEQHATPIEPISDEDALALSEMNAPSHPAPPMPLTDQEKLLVRIIHRADPVELAMLDPNMRSNEFTDSKAEFERFFAQPALLAPIKVNSSTPDVEPATDDSNEFQLETERRAHD